MMSFGDNSERPWVLDEDAAEPIVAAAAEGGVIFFDTANVYSAGASEVATGRLLGKLFRREDVVVATKVFMPMGEGENARGLSRKHILAAIDDSLRRLDMDYVDLYQIHRWDPRTPIEETMEALHDVVRAGKARYIGASSMFAWQFAKAQHVAERHGWTRFVSMQNHYNLLYREEEREMIPQCIDQGVAVIPWSPLARGVLAGTRPRAGQRPAPAGPPPWRTSRRESRSAGASAPGRLPGPPAAAEVRVRDVDVRPDLPRRPRRERASLIEDDDPVADLHDQGHVVVDQEHACLVLLDDRADDRGEFGHLRLGQPCRRFVHQDEARLGRERSGDAELALVAMR